MTPKGYNGRPPDEWAPEVVERIEVTRNVTVPRTIFVVKADREFDRGRPQCIGWRARLDGVPWVVKGVDCFKPAFPIREGEHISVYVEPFVEDQPGER